MESRRIAALAVGVVVLGAGWRWIASGLDAPLYRYTFASLFRLGQVEALFTVRYLLVAVAASALLGWGAAPLAAAVRRRPARLPFLPALAVLALLASAATLVLARTVLRDQVVTDDEYVYLFQARVLLSGHLVAPAPELPRFFDNTFVRAEGGRWFGQYPPGHPLMLVPGVALGAPRLVPVFLASVNVFLTGLLLRPLAGASRALLAVVFLIASPLFLLTGATLLSHSTAYAGLALGAVAALAAVSTGRARWGLVAGAGVGLTLLARPWTGLVLGAFPGALLVWGAARRGKRRGLVLFGAVLAIAVTLFLVANERVSGSPWHTGYDAVRGGGEREFGFGTIVTGVHEHTVRQGIVNVAILALRFVSWSLAWTLPLWLLAGRPCFPSPDSASLLPSRQSLIRGSGLMVLAGLLSYVPYWATGVNDTGPVKTYELLLPLGVLLAVAMPRDGAVRTRWGVPFLAAVVLLFWPVQVRHLRDLTARVRAPLAAVERTVRPPALVFAGTLQSPQPGSWVFGRPNPRPDLSDPIVYVRDLGPENDALWRRHPDRRAYRLEVRADGPRVTPLHANTEER